MTKAATSFLSIALIATLLGGCAAYKPPQTYQFDKDRVYPKSYDDVWQKAIEWFALQGTPVKNMDKSSGFIATEYNLSAERSKAVMDCGKAGTAGLLGDQTIENHTGNFNVLIRKVDENNTRVTVSTFFKAQSVIVTVGEPRRSVSTIDCNSTGLLEKELLDFIGK